MAVDKAARDKKMRAAEVERLAKLEYENPSTNVSKNGRCGSAFGETICPGRQCCSKNGQCGGSVGQYSTYCADEIWAHGETTNAVIKVCLMENMTDAKPLPRHGMKR